MSTKWVVAAFVVVAAIVVGAFLVFRKGPYAVTGGQATEYIMNVEPRANGSYMVWLGADTVTAYCTLDKTVYDQAQKFMDDRITVTLGYSTINTGDADSAILGHGCDSEKEGTTVLRLDWLRMSHSAQMTATAVAKAAQ